MGFRLKIETFCQIILSAMQRNRNHRRIKKKWPLTAHSITSSAVKGHFSEFLVSSINGYLAFFSIPVFLLGTVRQRDTKRRHSVSLRDISSEISSVPLLSSWIFWSTAPAPALRSRQRCGVFHLYIGLTLSVSGYNIPQCAARFNCHCIWFSPTVFVQHRQKLLNIY